MIVVYKPFLYMEHKIVTHKLTYMQRFTQAFMTEINYRNILNNRNINRTYLT